MGGQPHPPHPIHHTPDFHPQMPPGQGPPPGPNQELRSETSRSSQETDLNLGACDQVIQLGFIDL